MRNGRDLDNRVKMYNIALDIGGTKILGVLFDKDNNIVEKTKKKTKSKEGKEVVWEQIKKVIDMLVEKAGGIENINAIGAGVPGIINMKEGEVVFSPNLPWKNYKLKEIIEEEYSIKAKIGNDVNVGILGEWKFGAGRGKENIIGIFWGTGIGGGLIINNQLYEGKIGAAGEIGHICVMPDGPYCGCGARGCLESLASKTAMTNYIDAQIERGRKSILKELLESSNGVLKSDHIKQGIEKKDELTVEVIEKAAKYMGAGTASLINILNPEMIIFGGGVMESMGDILLPKIIEYARENAMPGILESCKFQVAELGDDSGIYGALTIALSGE